jgi:hypothetical protein
MLGLRHYRGLAIDLWQGHFSNFSCDSLVLLSAESANLKLDYNTEIMSVDHLDALSVKNCISIFLISNHRHMAVNLRDSLDVLSCEKIMFDLKVLVDSIEKDPLEKRITFIANCAEQHDFLQNALFSAFPDKD